MNFYTETGLNLFFLSTKLRVRKSIITSEGIALAKVSYRIYNICYEFVTNLTSKFQPARRFKYLCTSIEFKYKNPLTKPCNKETSQMPIFKNTRTVLWTIQFTSPILNKSTLHAKFLENSSSSHTNTESAVTKKSEYLRFGGKIYQSYVPCPHVNKICWVLVLEQGRVIYLNVIKKLIFILIYKGNISLVIEEYFCFSFGAAALLGPNRPYSAQGFLIHEVTTRRSHTTTHHGR